MLAGGSVAKHIQKKLSKNRQKRIVRLIFFATAFGREERKPNLS